MNDNKKPFVCTIEECGMTFTNEDHLNWHQKKHEMVLNLTLTSKNNDVADQTPTPTRFIRNCEEVGLFQDLQYVNPFEETFKKAVESNKTGNSLQVPSESNADDTLHTPHIFPPTDESAVTKSNNCDNAEENKPYPIKLFAVIKNFNSNGDTTAKTNLKNKLKQALIKNKAQKIDEQVKPKTVIIAEVRNAVQNDAEKVKGRPTIREMNRAAQLRCRKRKKIFLKKMEEELTALREQNAKLRMEMQEAQALRRDNAVYKKLLLEHKDCILEKHPNTGVELGSLFVETVVLPRPESPPKFVPIQPKQQTNYKGIIKHILIPVNQVTPLQSNAVIIPEPINGLSIAPTPAVSTNEAPGKNVPHTLQPPPVDDNCTNNTNLHSPTSSTNNTTARKVPIILQNPKNRKRKSVDQTS